MNQQTYRVQYWLDDDESHKWRETRVVITEGYSTFGDIPKILAVKHLGSNTPEDVARIVIRDCVIIGRIKNGVSA